MKKLYRAVIIILLCLICVLTLSSCIPPFIDGIIDSEEYFDSSVQYNTYQRDDGVVGGYKIFDTCSLPLSSLTYNEDNGEDSINMEHYYSFIFTTTKKVSINTVSFVVEVEDFTILNFCLVLANDDALMAAIFNQSIDLSQSNNRKKGVVQFTNLNLIIPENTLLKIMLMNPIMANVKYKIGTVLFIV